LIFQHVLGLILLNTLPNNGIKAFMTGFAPATRDALLAHLGRKPLLDLALPPADAGRSWPDMIQLVTRTLGGPTRRRSAVAGDTPRDMVA
jgi:phosphoglycolate phosphatase